MKKSHASRNAKIIFFSLLGSAPLSMLLAARVESPNFRSVAGCLGILVFCFASHVSTLYEFKKSGRITTRFGDKTAPNEIRTYLRYSLLLSVGFFVSLSGFFLFEMYSKK